MKRRLPLILVTVVIVICVAAAAVAAVASGVGGSAVAYRVNSTKVSQADFDDELRQIADHPNVMKTLLGVPVAATNGSITAQATTSWLGIHIPIDLMRQEAMRRKTTLGAAERKSGEQALSGLLQQVKPKLRLAQLPPKARSRLVDLFAYRLALKLADSTAFQTFVGQAVRKGHIAIDPRYGSFGPQGLCPPAGCPASSSSAGG
jgi:hypothetical protein